MKITIRITDPQGTTTEHVATGLKAARKKAIYLMGRNPWVERFSAVSIDGDRLTVSGCGVSELFPVGRSQFADGVQPEHAEAGIMEALGGRLAQP
jgi:hypothetical protein